MWLEHTACRFLTTALKKVLCFIPTNKALKPETYQWN
jgi:hypothetical protein